MMHIPKDPTGELGYIKIVAIVLLVMMVGMQITIKIAKSAEAEGFTVVFQGEKVYYACDSVPVSVESDGTVVSLGKRLKDAKYIVEDGVHIIYVNDEMDDLRKALDEGGYSYVAKVGVY